MVVHLSAVQLNACLTLQTRALYLGLYLPMQTPEFPWHYVPEHVEFAVRLRHGPWAQVVRRREIARRERIYHLENRLLTEHYLGGFGTGGMVESHYAYVEEYNRELYRLMGVTL